MSVTRRLAWRNIWRNRRRTILTLLVITFSTAILVFFFALQLSAYAASVEASMSIFQGHLEVQRRGYREKPEIRKTIEHGEEIAEALRAVAGVRAVSPRAFGFGLVSSASRSYGVQVVGVLPEYEGMISTIPRQTHAGKYLSSPGAYEAVVGSTLAANLHVKSGDEITLLGQARDGSVAAAVFTITGIFESGMLELDRNVIEIPLDVFQETFAMDGLTHALVLTTYDVESVPMVQELLAPVLARFDPRGELDILDWQRLSPGLRQAIQLDMSFGWLFYLSLVLIVTFVILNTFLMSLLERTREFGMMAALGMRPKRLVGMIVNEVLALTLVGIMCGLIIGLGVIVYYGHYGFQIPGSEHIMNVWGINGYIHPKVSARALTLGPLVLVAATLVAMFFPLLRLRALDPVEAMRQP